jgi:CheY-like chemotaxis protein
MQRLYVQLCGYDAGAWRGALSTLAASIHEIDRTATSIWFAFFPLELHQALESGANDYLTKEYRKGWEL